MSNIICGILNTKKKFYFSFALDSKILTIQPVKMNRTASCIFKHDFEDYPFLVKRMNISGETNENRYIEFINVKFASIGRGCFQAWVPAYILGLSNTIEPISKPNKITEILFKGECIDRMISARKIISDNLDYDNSKLTVNVDYGNEKIENFKYEKYDCYFVPSWTMPTGMKDVKNVLNVSTYLKIKSEKVISISKIIELYKDFEKLFSFGCHRQHVEFDSIIIKQIIPINYFDKIEDTVIQFKLVISSPDEEYDIPKIGKTLKITDEIDNISKLINSLKNDNFIILSFPFNFHEDSIVDNDKYINVSSSFESAFDKLFPNYKSEKSSDFKFVKESIINFIIEQSNNKYFNKKRREYFKDFKEYLELYEGSLEEKLQFAYKKYNYIIKDDINYFKSEFKVDEITYEKIACKFAKKRNHLSHGSKLEQFSDIEVLAYSFLKKINYAMVLEKSGFNEERIAEIIKQIF